MWRLAVPLSAGILLAAILSPAVADDPRSSLERYQENVKMSQMGPAIGVDERTVAKLVEIDRRYKPQKMQLNQDMKTDLQRLQQMLNQSNPSDEQVRQVLQAMIKKRQDTLTLQQRQLDEEMAILTPIQQGRYLLFLMGLRQQMAREARGLGTPMPQTAPPRGIPVSR